MNGKDKILLIILLCYFFSCDSVNTTNSSLFDLETAERIKEQVENLDKDLKSLPYLDSLAQVYAAKKNDDLYYMVTVMKVFRDSELSNHDKQVIMSEKINSVSFQKLPTFVKFIARRTYFKVLQEQKNYHGAIDQLMLAVSYLENEPIAAYKKYIADTYFSIGSISSNNLGDIEKSKVATIKAQKIYDEIGNHEKSEGALYALSVREVDQKNYKEAKIYAKKAIKSYKQHNSNNIDFVWKAYYAILVSIHANLHEADSVKLIYNEAVSLFEQGKISDDGYTGFCLTALEDLINIGLLETYTYQINRLEQKYMETCESRYPLGVMYKSKALYEKATNGPNEKEMQLKRLYYSTCGAPNRHFNAEQIETLNRLIEIDTKNHNYKDLNKWYEQKIGLSKLEEDKNKIYLTQLDYWSKKDLNNAEKEILYHKEKSIEVRKRFTITLIFTLLLMAMLFHGWQLYKKLKLKKRILEQQKVEIEQANQHLAQKNQQLDYLNIEINKKSGIISEQNKQLQHLVVDLEQSNESLKHFAYIAAHDLNAPLRTIGGIAKILIKKYNLKMEERDIASFNLIINNCASLQEIINGLLQFSKLSKEQGPNQVINLEQLVKKTVTMIKKEIEDSEVSILISPQLPTIQGHNSLIEQLFLNLINNAIKFRKKDQPAIINITHSSENDYFTRIAIQDNGIGIDPQYQEQIFQIFRKLHSPKEYKGSGIGLATCKKIVERYGGTISVESTLGEGTTFYFTLPKVNTADQLILSYPEKATYNISKPSTPINN